MKRWGRKETAVSPEEIASRFEALRALDMFDRASDDALRELARSMTTHPAAVGEEVIREGRLPTYLFVVRSGRLDVLSSGERGSEAKKVNELGPGDCFGEVGLIEGMPSTATVRAAIPCELYRIHGADFLSMVAMSEAMSEAMLERVAGRLETTHPSYRPAMVAGVAAAFKTLGFDDPVAIELEGSLRALAGLPPAKRREVLATLANALSSAEKS